MTYHFDMRMQERAISPEHVARALAGRCYERECGGALWYDPATRTAVILADDGAALTVYRMKKRQLKERFSR